MPPLGSLNINRTPMHSPPAANFHAEQQQRTSSYFGQAQPAQPQQVPHQQAVHSPPAEAHVQSWAGSTVEPQQPRPVPPMSNMWTPDTGIRFSGGGPGTAPAAGGQAPQGHAPHTQNPPNSTWDPNSGIRFG